MSLKLTLACGPYKHTDALRTSAVIPDGIELQYRSLSPPEIFWDIIKAEAFDVSEMSLSSYTMLLSSGDRRFVGLPVFPARAFRHSFIFVRADSGIETPSDLKGARIGVPEYHMTALLSIRGLLSDDYGVEPRDILWYQGGQEEPGRVERLDLDLPDEVRIERVADPSLTDLVAAGELDALATPTVPNGLADGSLPIRRLFGDPKAVEVDWYWRTGVFPIMHLLVVRREVFEAEQWVAASLVAGFMDAKRYHYRRLHEAANGLSPLPFLAADVQRTRAILGHDFIPYGVEKNKKTIESALRYSMEQHLSARPVELDELFAASVRDELMYR